MRLIAIGVACVVLAATTVIAHNSQAAPPNATARISGQVLATDTSRPIRGAVLRLVSFDVMRVAKSVVTDADGRFEFKTLLAGRYHLTASAERYLTMQYGNTQPPEPARPIDLSDGEHFNKADLSMSRAGAILGVILDEFGDPAPNVIVWVSQRVYAAGRPRLMPMGGSAQQWATDDKGQFRIFGLAPGDYYLLGLTGAFSELNDAGGFAPTFYPGTADAGSAQPVSLRFGQEVRVNLSLVAAPSSRVSGTLVDAADQPLPQGEVALVQSDRYGVSAFLVARGVAGADGRFVFRNVPRGAYTLQAFGRPVSGGNRAHAPFGWLPITVDDRDLTDQVLKVRTGTAARGRILFDTTTALPKASDVRISPRPIEFDSSTPLGGGPPSAVTREDWTFEVTNLTGMRVLRTDIASSIWTLKQITLNSKDITDQAVDFRTDDVSGIEITLTSRSATVTGTVFGVDGKPVAQCGVVIFSMDRAQWVFPSRFLQLARPNQQGQFIIRGLPPATYLVAALPTVQALEWEDPDFLERLRPHGTSFTLGEGDNRTQNLTLVKR